MVENSDDLSKFIESQSADEKQAIEALFPLLYDELHRLAEACIRNERSDHTLQATGLIHEAWMRMVPSSKNEDSPSRELSRQHFMARAAVVMRHILVNQAKAKNRLKRGGGTHQLAVSEIAAEFDGRAIDLVALNEELEVLHKHDPRQHRIVEMRFFGGLNIAECASVLGISERSAYLDWAHARAWLRSRFEVP
jgi:RNA polymerase sigma-70 factor, ECF subfamily